MLTRFVRRLRGLSDESWVDDSALFRKITPRAAQPVPAGYRLLIFANGRFINNLSVSPVQRAVTGEEWWIVPADDMRVSVVVTAQGPDASGEIPVSVVGSQRQFSLNVDVRCDPDDGLYQVLKGRDVVPVEELGHHIAEAAARLLSRHRDRPESVGATPESLERFRAMLSVELQSFGLRCTAVSGITEVTPPEAQRSVEPGQNLQNSDALNAANCLEYVGREDSSVRTDLRIVAIDRILLGRERTCDLVTRFLPRSEENDTRSAALSRRHAELQLSSDGLRIIDCGSASGVSVNGIRVQGQMWCPAEAFVLSLGCTLPGPDQYQLSVVPVKTGGISIEERAHLLQSLGLPEDVDRSRTTEYTAGAVLVQPVFQKEVTASLVAIWSHLLLGLDMEQNMILMGCSDHQGLARLLNLNGGLWLQCLSDTGNVRWLTRCLSSGELVPVPPQSSLVLRENRIEICQNC